MKFWAYVFVTSSTPRKAVAKIRRIPGVTRCDGLFRNSDAIAIVEAEDIASMDPVIDRIAELPGTERTDSKVGR